MVELIQQLIDGLGLGSEYALLALGIGLTFGVMRMINFAHGELITVSAYVAYGLTLLGLDWWDARAGHRGHLDRHVGGSRVGGVQVGEGRQRLRHAADVVRRALRGAGRHRHVRVGQRPGVRPAGLDK